MNDGKSRRNIKAKRKIRMKKDSKVEVTNGKIKGSLKEKVGK